MVKHCYFWDIQILLWIISLLFQIYRNHFYVYLFSLISIWLCYFQQIKSFFFWYIALLFQESLFYFSVIKIFSFSCTSKYNFGTSLFFSTSNLFKYVTFGWDIKSLSLILGDHFPSFSLISCLSNNTKEVKIT